MFLFETSLNSILTIVPNFLKMNWWTDPFTDSVFFRDWTVFYWAWWIAYAPFVGLFVTRISRGRTIRQVILGMTLHDSASYILASSATLRLEAGDDPPRWHRLFWAITLTILPLALMFIGGYEVLQTAVLVVSLPILVIGVLMSAALVKQLGADRARAQS